MFYFLIKKLAVSICMLTIIFVTVKPLLANEKEQPTVYTQAQIKEDFVQLYQMLELSHFNLYINKSKPEYQQAFEQFYAGITQEMTKAEIEIYFQRFMALGDVAHSRIDLPMDKFMIFREQGGKMLPLYVNFIGNKVKIDTVYSDNEKVQTGMTLLAIDGVPIDDWIGRFSSLISADSQALANTLIEYQLPFLYWLLEGEKQALTLRVKSQGKEHELELKALTREQQNILSAKQLNDNQSGKETKARAAKILKHDIAYLKPGPFYNIDNDSGNTWDNSDFIRFIDNAFNDFNAKNSKALVIDLRNNPGGTNSFSDHMIAWFADKPFRFASQFLLKVSPSTIKGNQQRIDAAETPDPSSLALAELYASVEHGELVNYSLPDAQPHPNKRFEKPVFVLINRKSYSNAVSVAAIVKDYGFGTILGEETTDFATTIASMEHFFLNNTQIKVGYPKALIVRPNGNKKPNVVTPDKYLSINVSASDNDEMLAEALGLIHSKLSQ